MVSVVVPVYNVEPYLRRCLDSIVGQTYTDLEVLLIDDGSTDGSGGICDEYAQDERVRVLHTENCGVAQARNLGLSEAKGTYVVFLDSDDHFDSRFLEKMVSMLERSGADMCICGYERFYEGDTQPPCVVRPSPYFEQGLYWRSDFGRHTFQVGGGAAWNKLFLLACDATFQDSMCYNDSLFSARVMWSARTVYLLDEPLAHYRRGRGTSIQDTKNLHILDALSVAEVLYDQLYDAQTFSREERLSLLERCVSLLFLSARVLADEGRYDEQVQRRIRADLDAWDVTALDARELGDIRYALRVSLLRYATCAGVKWAYRGWSLPSGQGHSIMQKVGLGMRIAVAVVAGRAHQAVANHRA
jgi:glycosyltransferase involved in cell wall biosynthesis